MDRFLWSWKRRIARQWNELAIRNPQCGLEIGCRIHSTGNINLLAVLLFPTFALAADAAGMQMQDVNRWRAQDPQDDPYENQRQ
ncbi:hypothetical protein JF546_14790 [Nitratireductor aquimarinus]|uniref:hypothetical protein n=1 Tax=Nitratireductor TaxID=245876 RepID=UPI0019D40E09|nr:MULTISPECIES: hypothetical protein [Nitratireductor]MBN7762318.1 hypothetical protein [Nitratireductor aquibiodomus]MBN7777960.1 hypothetical protein [Nitratireductor pacificus]MBN7782282.1 hypothetical protein [Nitratireductor pacificus]MBN7791089.1 hypothetical protein [Nitratireductor aquimarinus]MBN8244284.1 hypothetical protein [Nitratireductor aquimarinus]